MKCKKLDLPLNYPFMAERKKKRKRQRRSGLLLKEQEWPLVERGYEPLPSRVLQFHHRQHERKEKNWGGRSNDVIMQGAQAIRDEARTRSRCS